MFSPRTFGLGLLLFGSLLIGSFIVFAPEARAEDEARTIDAIAGFCQVKRPKAIVRRARCCRPRYCKPRHFRKRPHKKIRVARSEAPCPVTVAPSILVIQTHPSFRCFRKLLTPGLYAVDPLPPCFKVYSNEHGFAVPHPSPDFVEKHIPTVNLFDHTPGCYVACYSKNPDKAVYSVTPTIYLIGQIRVRGNYVGRQCVPEYYENADIRAEKFFKELCSKSFSCPGNSCWAGGDTGIWFGL